MCSGVTYWRSSELSARLEFVCTNNQAEYESLLHGLEFLVGMGVKEVEAMGDSSLEVQKIRGEHQCLNRVLNRYRDKCLDLLKLLGTFCIRPISREENQHASDLAQQASGYEVRQGMFMIKQNPMMALGDTASNDSTVHRIGSETTEGLRPVVSDETSVIVPNEAEGQRRLGVHSGENNHNDAREPAIGEENASADWR
jgi:ribonuclease HI